MKHASLVTMNDHVLAAMDTETSGRDPNYNEVVQIAIVLLDVHLNPFDQFYTNVRPQHPERMHPDALATHGLTEDILKGAPSRFVVIDSLWEWFQRLNMAPGKKLIPLCHNSQFDIPFVQAMLGHEQHDEIFGHPTRDTQASVCYEMDKAAFQGYKGPFPRAKLDVCCEALGIKLDNAHDALADALATARLYKALISR